ncbi:MAG: TetR/AcrR family transcriptional regulator [Parasporobacterium sp.]|nr:TetR/AcrR family transcriptional regulator [Parasporobacterium sp.]
MGHTQTQLDALKRSNAESNAVTREAVQDALFILMEKKDYEEIRITELIQKAGIARSAFYRNYKTKDDVLLDYIGDIHQLLMQNVSRDVRKNWLHYIRSIRENREKFELLIKTHREWFVLDSLNELADYSSGTDFTTVLPHGYIYNIVMYWVKCGMPGTDEEAVERIMQACRENGEVMISGVIPEKSLETTKAKKIHRKGLEIAREQ